MAYKLSLFASLLIAVPLSAQVRVVTTTTLYNDTPVAAGQSAKYSWYGDPGLTLKPIGNGSAATPSGNDGAYNGVSVAVIDGKPTPSVFQVVLGDAPAPTPVSTLRSLVESDKQAADVAEYLTVLADNVGKIADAVHFWKTWNDSFPALANVPLNTALKARLEPAVVKKTGLSVELRAVAQEFVGSVINPPKPIPPQPTPTIKPVSVLLLRESKDQTPEMGSLIAKMQSVGSDYEWFKSNKIRVDVLDPDQRENNEPIPIVEKLKGMNPLPEFYVLDANDNVIAHRDVDTTTTSGQLMEFTTRQMK